MYHLRAEYFVTVKRPADAGVVGLTFRLGNVVHNGSPAEPQIIALMCHIIKHFERMFEVVFVGVITPALHTAEGVQFGEYYLQQSRQFEQFKTYKGWKRNT